MSGFEVDEDDEVYPTSPGRIQLLRLLSFGLAALLLLFLVLALAL